VGENESGRRNHAQGLYPIVLFFLPASGPEGEGTRLLLTHANVPDDQAEELKKGWTEFYWKPWKAWTKKASLGPLGRKNVKKTS
jgi:hypothetical protein